MQRNGTLAESPAPAASGNAPETTTSPGASEQTDSPSVQSPASSGEDTQRTGNDWFREAFNARRYGPSGTRQPEAPAAENTSNESDASSDAQPKVPASAEGTDGKQPEQAQKEQTKQERVTRTFSEEEFRAEVARQAQAETDRRLDKFQREEAERRRQAELRSLRDKDPYGYVKLEKEEEAKRAALQQQLAQAHRMTLSTVEAYDKTVLDPLMQALPKAQQDEIISSIEPGLPGRGQAATKALKALESHWKQQGVTSARETLMNDQSFIKEVLARHGGMRQEPDNIPAASAPARRTTDVNQSLRNAVAALRG